VPDRPVTIDLTCRGPLVTKKQVISDGCVSTDPRVSEEIDEKYQNARADGEKHDLLPQQAPGDSNC
jgi:hypothetical protein